MEVEEPERQENQIQDVEIVGRAEVLRVMGEPGEFFLPGIDVLIDQMGADPLKIVALILEA